MCRQELEVFGVINIHVALCMLLHKGILPENINEKLRLGQWEPEVWENVSEQLASRLKIKLHPLQHSLYLKV